MKTLWTFESQTKAELFAALLREADIASEARPSGKNKNSANEVTISVDERDFERAKKALMKHRKRRTTT